MTKGLWRSAYRWCSTILCKRHGLRMDARHHLGSDSHALIQHCPYPPEVVRDEMNTVSTQTPDSGTMCSALELACRAPSLHNSQPWRWRVAEHTVHLYADPERLLNVVDPDGRELVISCGAALHHARVAFASLGWRSFVHRLPNPAEPLHLAALEFVRMNDIPTTDVALARAIATRRSDRRPFLPDPVPAPVLRRLVEAAKAEHASLTVADTEAAERELVVAMAAVNELQRGDARYRAELAAWAGRGTGAVEGVPASGLRVAGQPGRPVLGRDFSAAGGGDLIAPPLDDGATLAVLSTELDDRRSWLRAGEALSAVLLTATVADLATCPLSQIAEADLARDTVRDAVLKGAGEPQLLVRIGWPVTAEHPAPLSPRRPLADVLDRFPQD